jgi:hypothetical protein
MQERSDPRVDVDGWPMPWPMPTQEVRRALEECVVTWTDPASEETAPRPAPAPG